VPHKTPNTAAIEIGRTSNATAALFIPGSSPHQAEVRMPVEGVKLEFHLPGVVYIPKAKRRVAIPMEKNG